MIKTLERREALLRRQEAKLLKERQNLLLKNALLTALCEALTLLGGIHPASTTAPAASAVGHEDALVREHFQILLQEEASLLNELTLSDQLASLSQHATLPDPGPHAISPGDPMRYVLCPCCLITLSHPRMCMQHDYFHMFK
jgi:hypothetical protein